MSGITDHREFDMRPTVGQFALNGIWEDALSFAVEDPPATAALDAWLDGENELAFELFFGASFFGIRFSGSPGEILALSRHCLNCMNQARNLDTFLTAVEEHPLCKGLCGEADFMELGAVNAWQSVGSYRLPPPAKLLDDLDTFWPQICSSPLYRDVSHSKAVEVAYSTPLPHWLGFPVCSPQPPYRLSKEMLHQVVRKFTA